MLEGYTGSQVRTSSIEVSLSNYSGYYKEIMCFIMVSKGQGSCQRGTWGSQVKNIIDRGRAVKPLRILQRNHALPWEVKFYQKQILFAVFVRRGGPVSKFVKKIQILVVPWNRQCKFLILPKDVVKSFLASCIVGCKFCTFPSYNLAQMLDPDLWCYKRITLLKTGGTLYNSTLEGQEVNDLTF